VVQAEIANKISMLLNALLNAVLLVNRTQWSRFCSC